MPTIEQHFARRAPEVRAIYDAIVAAARELGPVMEDPKKTSIHLTRETAFAGVATRKDAVILTLKSGSDIKSPRVVRRQRTSANRWHVELRLDDPKQVDGQLKGWLRKAVALAS